MTPTPELVNGRIPRWFLLILAGLFATGGAYWVRDVYATGQTNSSRITVLETKLDFIMQSQARVEAAVADLKRGK